MNYFNEVRSTGDRCNCAKCHAGFGGTGQATEAGASCHGKGLGPGQSAGR